MTTENRTESDRHTTARAAGVRIGEAIARDVVSDGLPRQWSGLDPQDTDQIPAGCDCSLVESYAQEAYYAYLARMGR